MNKKYFALKLNPSRPDFAQTMADEERLILRQHAAYWKNYMGQEKVVFGPVVDPNAVYGFGVLAVNDEQAINNFIAGDPVNKINSYEYYPMLAVLPGN